MNTVILTGRLTKQPEVKMTPKGNSVTSFSIAVDRDQKSETGENIVDFINCVAWGRLAEVLAKWGYKGQKVMARGRIQVRVWTTKDGVKQHAVDVVVNALEFLSRKNTDAHDSQPEDFVSVEEADIPF